jgi:hypothetical protein
VLHVHKKLSEVVLSKIFQNFSPMSDLITVREHLLLFQHEHRARDGYIYIRNAEAEIDRRYLLKNKDLRCDKGELILIS